MAISARTEIEDEDHEVLQERKKKTGITIEFQIREAIKMYVDKIRENTITAKEIKNLITHK